MAGVAVAKIVASARGAVPVPYRCQYRNYVVAVNADVPPIEVHFVSFPDMEINALAPAGSERSAWRASPLPSIDAVRLATGVRVRELLVKIEDLLA